jgi:SHS2 domain-containing protein
VYRWVDHTSELELEIAAADAEGVLADALAAFAELAAGEAEREGAAPAAGEAGREGAAPAAGEGEPEAAGPPETRELSLEAPDRAALLAEWLGELAFLAEVDGFVPVRCASLTLDGPRLRATVEGRLGSPAHLVKAVTYHRLRFEPTTAGWEATVVLDV